MEQTGPVHLVQGSEIDFSRFFCNRAPLSKTVMIASAARSSAGHYRNDLSLVGLARRPKFLRGSLGIKHPNAKSLREVASQSLWRFQGRTQWLLA